MASDTGTYRGLLIDWGGVLTTDVFASFSVFCEHEGLEPDAVIRVFRDDAECRELMLGLETGAVAEERFEPPVAALLGVEPAGLLDRLFGASRPDEQMLETVRRVRAGGTRTGLLSNSWGTTRYPRDLLAELFDAVVISGEVGMRKPAPEIYALGAEQLGLAPGDCVFVDDLSVNLGPAAELGMATVHHRTTDDTIAQLEPLFGVSLR
jgi:epoxide hydrolase-like predicted phosphatase